MKFYFKLLTGLIYLEQVCNFHITQNLCNFFNSVYFPITPWIITAKFKYPYKNLSLSYFFALHFLSILFKKLIFNSNFFHYKV